MLCCYADELKEGFFPWIDQVMLSLLKIRPPYLHFLIVCVREELQLNLDLYRLQLLWYLSLNFIFTTKLGRQPFQVRDYNFFFLYFTCS
jgi:hypothetical protein